MYWCQGNKQFLSLLDLCPVFLNSLLPKIANGPK